MTLASGVGLGFAQNVQNSYSGSPLRRNGMSRCQSASGIRSIGVSNKDWFSAANLQDRSKRMDVLVRKRSQAVIGDGLEVKMPSRPVSSSGSRAQLSLPSVLLHRPNSASMTRLPPLARSNSVPSSGAAMNLLRDREVLVRQKFNVYGDPRHVGAVSRADVPAILQDLGVCSSTSPRLDRLITDSLGTSQGRDVSFQEFVKLQNDYQADYVKPIKYEIGETSKARRALGAPPPGSEREREEAEKDLFRMALEAALEQGEEESLKDDFIAALERALDRADDMASQQADSHEALMDKARNALSIALDDNSDDEHGGYEALMDKARNALSIALDDDSDDEEGSYEALMEKARNALSTALDDNSDDEDCHDEDTRHISREALEVALSGDQIGDTQDPA